MLLSVDHDVQHKTMLWGLCKGNDCQMLRKMLLIVSLTEPETSFVKLFHPKNAIDSTYSLCSDTDCQFPAFEHRTILSVFCSCPSALSLLLCKEERYAPFNDQSECCIEDERAIERQYLLFMWTELFERNR